MQAAATQGISCVGVAMDSDGIIPEELDKVVAQWDEGARGSRKPKVLSMVP
jgi:aromatic amino acid aminotransferase I